MFVPRIYFMETISNISIKSFGNVSVMHYFFLLHHCVSHSRKIQRKVNFYHRNTFRGQPELKEKIASCVGVIGGVLGGEAGRYVYIVLNTTYLCSILFIVTCKYIL